MTLFLEANGIIDRIVQSTDKVHHITAFIKEEKLIFALECVILGFLSLSLVILGMILLRRTIMQKQVKEAKILRGKYETLLAELMSCFYENDKIFGKKNLSVSLSKADKTKPFNRQIFLEQILLMKHHVGGEEAEVLNYFYEKLGFKKAALKRLKNKKWFLRMETIQELMTMEVSGIDPIFFKMTLDKHQLVRIAAIKALILKDALWQPALIKYAFPLSPWEQYHICDALSKRQSIKLPDFTPLLKSVNPTVVEFALKMIKHFHCLEAVPQTAAFIKHDNPKIATAARDVMKQFDLEDIMEDRELLAEMFA